MVAPFLAVLVLILIAFEVLKGTGLVESTDDTMTVQAPPITTHIDPTNENTWPTGDKIWDICRAIARAEGYNVSGSVPSRLNNPGDLSDGKGQFGSEHHSGSDVTTFPDAVTGWSWLYTKVARAAQGQSAVYLPSFDWYDIAGKWAPPNADVWAENVSGALGVSPTSTLGDYVNG